MEPHTASVGRFRAGYVLNDRPATVTEWRVTTGDPEVANAIHDILGGEAPQTWEAKGEDNLEVFSASKEVEIIIRDANALRQRLVLWGRNGKPIRVTDGEYVLDERGQATDEPDPDASLTLAERKQKAKDGTGPEPDVDLFFRLAEDPDLGIFKFKTASWGFASDLARNDTFQDIEDYATDADGRGVRAVLKLEPVSFVAKNGPRAGQTVSYTASRLEIVGPVPAAA